MHRCLSCNQPCSLFSAFCDSCRASLLERQEQPVPAEQPELVGATGRSDVGGGYADCERGEGADRQAALSQSEVPPAGLRAEPEYTLPPIPVQEKSLWTFEKSDFHGMKTEALLDEASQTPKRADVAQVTRWFVVPPRPRRVMPASVRRALLIFCIVGVLAFLTDGVLLAISMLRHHEATNVPQTRLGRISQQGDLSTADQNAPTPATVVRAGMAPLLVLSAQRLLFSAAQGQSNLAAQTVTLSAHHRSFAWRIEPIDKSPAWLHLSVWQGSARPGATSAFAVNALPDGLAPGIYTARVLVKAFDTRNHALTGTPVPLTVALNIHSPCELTVAPEKLKFTSVLVSEPAPQTLTLSASPDCTSPVSWQSSSDEPWVTLSPPSGVDGSSITVQASTAGKLIGTYTAHITFQATDSSGVFLVVSPATITVTLTVIA